MQLGVVALVVSVDRQKVTMKAQVRGPPPLEIGRLQPLK